LQNTDPLPVKVSGPVKVTGSSKSPKKWRSKKTKEIRKLKSWMIALDGEGFRGILKRQIFSSITLLIF
jgi:hypothetical protein